MLFASAIVTAVALIAPTIRRTTKTLCTTVASNFIPDQQILILIYYYINFF